MSRDNGADAPARQDSSEPAAIVRACRRVARAKRPKTEFRAYLKRKLAFHEQRVELIRDALAKLPERRHGSGVAVAVVAPDGRRFATIAAAARAENVSSTAIRFRMAWPNSGWRRADEGGQADG